MVPGFFLYLHNKNEEIVNKMQWLVDAFVNNRLDKTFKFRISESKQDYGTVCMPTGTGKSGVMIEDILRRVKESCARRIIINLSCPTLKLSQQLVTDLFETMHGVFTRDCMDSTCLVLNSSDSPYNYNTYGCSVYSGSELAATIESAMHDSKYILVIASCHKSLQKFVSVTDKFCNISIYNYICTHFKRIFKPCFKCICQPFISRKFYNFCTEIFCYFC